MWTLARKLLFHDRLRFAVAIAGVSVSVMLVLVQVGLYFGFMDTASSVIADGEYGWYEHQHVQACPHRSRPLEDHAGSRRQPVTTRASTYPPYAESAKPISMAML